MPALRARECRQVPPVPADAKNPGHALQRCHYTGAVALRAADPTAHECDCAASFAAAPNTAAAGAGFYAPASPFQEYGCAPPTLLATRSLKHTHPADHS